MKILLLPFICVASLSLNAQIVLDANNVLHSSTYQLDRTYNNVGISIPSQGLNQNYDYSQLPSPTSNVPLNFSPATRAGFTNFTRFQLGTSSFSSFTLQSEYYTHVDSSGVKEVGSYKTPQKFGLGTVTGNISDTLDFPGSISIFQLPYFTLKFPSSYGSIWQDEVIFLTDFILTVSAFGLNQTPGLQKQIVIHHSEVVGWGDLILPTIGGASIPNDILLVKHQAILIDSFFLGGTPAPTALLNAFGVTQGDTSYQNEYLFYAENLEQPLFVIYMNDDWSAVDFSHYDATSLQTVGIKNFIDKQQVSMFPNPVKASSFVEFTGVEKLVNPKISIYSITGELVYKEIMNYENGSSWQVPSLFRDGMYHYILHSVTTEKSFSGKLIIKN